MNEFSVVLAAVLPVFAIAGAGISMRKLNWLTEEADQSLLKITINLLSPCLILDSVLKNEALHHLSNLLAAPLVGFGTVALGLVAGSFLGKKLKLHDMAEERTFAFTTGIYNYGYLPMPLALLLFNRQTLGVLLVHNVGVEIAYWTLGLAVLQNHGPSLRGAKILNAPLVAILIALVFNFTGGYKFLPKALLSAIQMLGQCAIPIGLILIGAIMADHLGDFHAKNGWKVMFFSCLLRLGVLPVFFLLLARFLPVPVELKRVIIIQAAMPSAVFAIVMAKHFKGSPPTALQVVVATSLAGLVTIPLWIRLGARFAGL